MMLDYNRSLNYTWEPEGRQKRWWGALINSNRGVLLGALFFAIVVPEIFHSTIAAHFKWAQYARFGDLDQPEIIMSVIALILAHMSLQKVNSLPLVGDKMAVVPAFVMTYGAAVIFLGFVVREFGRYHFTTSFCIGIAWYLLVSFLRARTNVAKMAIVGELPEDEILQRARISWITLHTPRLPQGVSGIVFDKTKGVSPQFERLFARAVLRQVPVFELAHFRELVTGRMQLQSRPEEAFGEIRPSRPYIRAKRVIAFSTGVVALLIASPVLLIAALIIRLESPGPALFRQNRVGYKGRRFTCYKLRTMRADVEGAPYTIEGDPRITPFGRLLRRTRVDELPQLLNIIKGEMCWIGPRPESVKLAKLYERAIPYYGYRHLVRPGVTGWAAVHQGNVALQDAAMRKLEYDFYYIRHCSPWLDFLIVLMTIRTILTGFGSR